MSTKLETIIIRNRISHAVSQSISLMPSPARSEQSPTPRTHVFYAIVQHDFVAERPDELDAKRGDAITVVAQSNREWFVAKPIGRLGRPGLIPVSFVEIHDPATGAVIKDVEGLMDRGELPKVEEWKRAMQNYKQNSIALGVIDAPVRSPLTTTSNTHHTKSSTQQDFGPPRARTPDCLPEGLLLSADVVSFHYEMDEYWFRIDALFQPYNRPGQTKVPSSKNLILFRVYSDFYDFQVSLLEAFPREAGRYPPEPRTLPYMPGPATDVDDALTATRRVELNDYIHGLCNLARTGQRYILEHQIVRTFLALKPGDVANDGEPRVGELEALFSSDDSEDWYTDDAASIQRRMDRMAINSSTASEGSDYEEERRAPSRQKSYDAHPYSQAGRHALDRQVQAQNHSRSGSSASFHNPSMTSYGSRSGSPRYGERKASPGPPRNGGSQYQPHQQHGSTPSVDSTYQKSPNLSLQITTNKRSNPSISAANPQTAFVKIKIFDRVADDLIAIRVHPKVTHAELMGKVQSRLGSEVRCLRYRDSMTNTFVGLDNDEELRAWMEGTDKHVLYAD